MHSFIRYIGITLIAVGLAILMFIVMLRLTTPRELLSPVPQDIPAKGEHIGPSTGTK